MSLIISKPKANDGLPVKYRVGMKGYEIDKRTGKPKEIYGEKIVNTILEVHNDEVNNKKETTYWCKGIMEKSKKSVGSYPIDESLFKPISGSAQDADTYGVLNRKTEVLLFKGSERECKLWSLNNFPKFPDNALSVEEIPSGWVVGKKVTAQDGIDKHYREYSDGADRETKAAIENIGKAINDAMKIAEKWVHKNRVGSSGVLSKIRYGMKERYDNEKSELLRLASLMNAEELDD